jgi:hypothetical protein
VILFGSYFIILFSQSSNLKYIAIPTANPTNPGTATTLVTNYSAGSSQLAFDGTVFNNNLYIAYNGSDGGGAVRMTYLNSFLVRQTGATGTNVANGKVAAFLSICAQQNGSTSIWVTFYISGVTETYTLAVDLLLNSILAATRVATIAIANVATTCINGIVSIFYEAVNTYSYGTSLPSNFIAKITSDKSGTLVGPTTILRSVGLASKAITYGDDLETYFWFLIPLLISRVIFGEIFGRYPCETGLLKRRWIFNEWTSIDFGQRYDSFDGLFN